ncbi:hypothetical protein EKO27_g7189 [Xylaria grammica]|uniref:Uncharacterized protein n=1 Tax=Xylaria grammica TaxID=363999 RepID=A0A439D0E1_9PEZI|nr:hypothetical protein EKO27_g7189 [Xylaria grammica]
MSSSNIAYSGSLEVSLNYLARIPLWEDEKPWEMWTKTVPDGLGKRTNVQFETVKGIVMQDVRDIPEGEKPTIEREGFEYLYHPFPVSNLPDVEIDEDATKRAAMTEYLSSMTALLRDHFHGTKAICYDWRVRKATPRSYDKNPTVFFRNVPDETEIREQLITAAYNVHGDGAPNSFKKQLLYLLTPDEQYELAQGKVRLQAINMWRPVVDVVQLGPLAMCDCRSVAEEDWESVDKVFDNWVEDSMYLKHSPRHQWYWLSNQTKNEVTIFSLWDSLRPDKKSASTAHCSFALPGDLSNRQPRQSIEMRLLLWSKVPDV